MQTRWPLSPLLLGALLALGGCSGDSTPNGPTPSGSATETNYTGETATQGGATPTATLAGGTSTEGPSPSATGGLTATPGVTLVPSTATRSEGTASATASPDLTQATPSATFATEGPTVTPTATSPLATPTAAVDADGDGFTGAGGDCDDADALVYPGAAEQPYDGVDQDCDGADLTDVDEDGQEAVIVGGADCDDENADIRLGATEIPYDDIDQDCDGSDLVDVDGDTYVATQAGGDDCDDDDAGTYPGATEIGDGDDNDCDGVVDEDLNTTDDDGDGYSEQQGDCDDYDTEVSPAATEICNEIDDDCDGSIDVDADDAQTFYADDDADGFGDSDSPVEACALRSGLAEVGGDCDDEDDGTYPEAAEACDGADNDCDEGVDEGETQTYYADTDTDGFGDGAASIQACQAPEGYVVNSLDCDDTDTGARPGAQERCNNKDDDCDSAVDEGKTSPFYPDTDFDGYGTAQGAIEACEAGVGYSASSGDCDDDDANVNPGAQEVCNALDDDCDGAIDSDDNSVSGEATWFIDYDGDGYGAPVLTLSACGQPNGYVGNSDDCDDRSASINPSASEVCNDIDDDCDGAVDSDDASVSGETTWFIDYDGDGFGVDTITLGACSQPTGYVGNSDDCDDLSASVNPGGQEVCNEVDDDCDGAVDDADDTVDGGSTWYADGDGDGFGVSDVTQVACAQPDHYVSVAGDCDDDNGGVNPDGAEVCGGGDEDCDGDVDDADDSVTGGSTWYADLDGDGFGDAGSTQVACAQPTNHVDNAGDCDDSDASVNPDGTEVCGGGDEDCDGDIDDADDSVADGSTWYADDDGDGYGDAGSTQVACLQPANHVDNAQDCDDSNVAVNPAAEEICNDLDDDCDSDVDEGACGPPSPVTFDYTGGAQTFTVPGGVTSVTLTAYGAEGRKSDRSSYAAGKGGMAEGTLAVTPGQTLYVYVGGQAGYNGGGPGWSASSKTTNGGGASDVRVGGTGIANRVIVAGGGGGVGGESNWGSGGHGGGGNCGSNYCGGGAGGGYGFNGGVGGVSGGSSGSNCHGGGGGGGGLNSGGSGATASCYGGSTGGTGSQAGGGSGAATTSGCCQNYGVGGGGGGYFGGGGAAGGCCGGGAGGGGSSWTGSLTGPVFDAGVRSGNGQVVISW